MAANTKIEWAHHTFNPWIGCSKVSAGCANCYAEEMMDKRYGRAKWGDAGTRVRTSDANWRKPLQWDKAAAAAGERHRVFCASLADVFENRPELDQWRADLFQLIRATPHLDWLLLTKRPENIKGTVSDTILNCREACNGRCQWLQDWLVGAELPNLWIGTSVENQEQADKRIPELLKIPAKVRFLSMEPLLGPVELFQWMPSAICYECDNEVFDTTIDMHCGEFLDWTESGIQWVIVGGESGHNARPMEPQWVMDIQSQCAAAGVPFFFKQGSQANWHSYKDFDNVPVGLRVREVPLVTV